MSSAESTVDGILVVDLTRQLSPQFAALELQRLGDEVVRPAAPRGDSLRELAPECTHA